MSPKGICHSCCARTYITPRVTVALIFSVGVSPCISTGDAVILCTLPGKCRLVLVLQKFSVYGIAFFFFFILLQSQAVFFFVHLPFKEKNLYSIYQLQPDLAAI